MYIVHCLCGITQPKGSPLECCLELKFQVYPTDDLIKELAHERLCADPLTKDCEIWAASICKQTIEVLNNRYYVLNPLAA